MKKFFVERKSDCRDVRAFLTVAIASWAMSGACLAQSSLDHGLDPLAATTVAAIAAEEPLQGRAWTAEQEKALALRFEVLERAVESNHTGCQSYEDVLGKNRCRDLNRALFDYNLNSAMYGYDLWENPYSRDEPADAVLSAYSKMQREALEHALGLEEWWDRRRPDRGTRAQGPRPLSYKVRVSPRFSSDYLGMRFKMPYTGMRTLDHMSFQMRYDFDESRPIYSMRFEDDSRFFRLVYEPGTERFGDLVSLSTRFAW